MSKKFQFSCGCSFDYNEQDKSIVFDYNIENINIECERTWQLIGEGNTKGIFQLESRLGSMMAKKLKPENIEQLSALISIIRPGALDAIRDGKSVTNHYVDKKNGLESIDYFHSSLEPSLKSTLGEMIYQEQAMQIAKDIAGFDLKEADNLRKCIAEDSLVMTKTGPKKIQDLCNKKINAQILTLDKNNKTVFKKIKNVWFSGIQKVFEIITTNGFRIELTENHKVFTQRGWVEVKKLSDNDYVILPKKYAYGGNNRYSIDETILISYILSEGYHIKGSNTTIVNQNVWIINLLKNILTKRFGKESFSVRKSNGCFVISLKNYAQKWADKNISHAKSRDKTIPKGVTGSTNRRSAAFIGSFFSAEGSVSEYSLEISSISLSMIQSLQMMLLRDGIFASIQVHNSKYKNEPYISYKLSISTASNIKLFGKLYGKYIVPSKLKEINNFRIRADHNSSFLVPKTFIRAATQNINVNELVTSPTCGSLYNCSLTYDKARWLNNYINSDLLQETLDADYRYVKIRKITESIEKNTYDFEVNDNHSHFGFINGICVHNCIAKKQSDKMAIIKSKFLEGCKSKNIVNENEAEQIFGWIEKGQRYSFNKSILDDTVVISECGEKTIRELNVGEKILAPTAFGNEYVEVVNKYDHGEQEVFKITLENGSHITCTMEHKFLCSDDKTYPLSEILLNDFPIYCSNKSFSCWSKIEKIGTRPTVDIEVKSDNHIFYGNGMATSNSHGVSYAINAYLSAYVKAHFPKEFFAAYLKFAKNKVKPQDEIKALIQNAREMNIDVVSPDIRKLNAEFILQDDRIYFGLTDIKGVGESVFNKLQNIIDQNNIDIVNIDWINLLYKILVNINSTASKSLIEAGALDFTKKSRSSMLYEYQLVSELTKKELQFIIDNISSSKNVKNDIIYLLEFGKTNKNRKKVLENVLNMLNNPSYSLNDNPEWIADVEYNTLGCSLTCSKVDMYDISMTNISCKELKNSVMFDSIILGGEVEYANVTKTKTGQNKGQEMAFVSLSDSTGVADSIIFFPEQYKKYKNILFSGNVIILKGNKTKTGDGLIVEKAYIAKT